MSKLQGNRKFQKFPQRQNKLVKKRTEIGLVLDFLVVTQNREILSQLWQNIILNLEFYIQLNI